MKKLISIAILFVIVMALATTMVSAVTSSTLGNELYSLGAKYGVSKATIERTIKELDINDSQAGQVLAQAKEAVAVMENAGVTDVTKLSQEDRNQLISIANTTASVVGADVTLKDGKIYIDKDGKTLEVVSFQNGKLVYTGNSVNTILVVSSIAIVALTTAFVVRRKSANA